MFKDEAAAVCNTARGKLNLLEKNPLGYLIMSMLAGLFIGLGSILMGTVGGLFTAGGAYSTRLINGLVFSVGLCLGTMAGAEFVGTMKANHATKTEQYFTTSLAIVPLQLMAVAGFRKTESWGKIAKLWVICWVGNLIGSVITAAIFTGTGLATGDIGTYMANLAVTKASGGMVDLFAKAVMCNICVCLAIWCGAKMKSEGGKIAMNVCCVVTFVTCGFEHSVANMTFFAVGLMNPNGMAISMSGVIMNLIVVTIGNMIGGIICVALPYYLISKDK